MDQKKVSFKWREPIKHEPGLNARSWLEVVADRGRSELELTGALAPALSFFDGRGFEMSANINDFMDPGTNGRSMIAKLGKHLCAELKPLAYALLSDVWVAKAPKGDRSKLPLSLSNAPGREEAMLVSYESADETIFKAFRYKRANKRIVWQSEEDEWVNATSGHWIGWIRGESVMEYDQSSPDSLQ